MFNGAAAFNQPLSFNTASVTNVRVNLCLESDRYERLDSDFQFLSNLSSDGLHVCRCNGIQSTTTFWYCFGCICEIISVWVQLQLETRFWFPISYPTYHQMDGMFRDAAAFNQPLAFDTASVTNVRVLLVWSSTQWETRFWFPISYPTYHQMYAMFYGSAAFNQPLSFDTASVTNVRVHLFGVQSQWETRFWFSILTNLLSHPFVCALCSDWVPINN